MYTHNLHLWSSKIGLSLILYAKEMKQDEQKGT